MRKAINLIGAQYGRLTVEADSGCRTSKGSVIWRCICACGTQHNVAATNLKAGSVKSCGCLHRELSSERRKARKQPKPFCIIPECTSPAEEFGRTLCAKHAQRKRRYGDPNYITPESIRSINARNAQLKRVDSVKQTTYRKLLGKHEHRVIGELLAGRRLERWEHVHHKDENKHNNDPSNLEIMTASEHLRHHAAKKKAGK